MSYQNIEALIGMSLTQWTYKPRLFCELVLLRFLTGKSQKLLSCRVCISQPSSFKLDVKETGQEIASVSLETISQESSKLTATLKSSGMIEVVFGDLQIVPILVTGS